MGVPVSNTSTNLLTLLLDTKGEKFERRVYSIWDLLADIGGFKDGLVMVLGGFFTLSNSKWFFIDFNKSLFKVKDQGKARRRKLKRDRRKMPV